MIYEPLQYLFFILIGAAIGIYHPLLVKRQSTVFIVISLIIGIIGSVLGLTLLSYIVTWLGNAIKDVLQFTKKDIWPDLISCIIGGTLLVWIFYKINPNKH